MLYRSLNSFDLNFTYFGIQSPYVNLDVGFLSLLRLYISSILQCISAIYPFLLISSPILTSDQLSVRLSKFSSSMISNRSCILSLFLYSSFSVLPVDMSQNFLVESTSFQQYTMISSSSCSERCSFLKSIGISSISGISIANSKVLRPTLRFLLS